MHYLTAADVDSYVAGVAYNISGLGCCQAATYSISYTSVST